MTYSLAPLIVEKTANRHFVIGDFRSTSSISVTLSQRHLHYVEDLGNGFFFSHLSEDLGRSTYFSLCPDCYRLRLRTYVHSWRKAPVPSRLAQVLPWDRIRVWLLLLLTVRLATHIRSCTRSVHRRRNRTRYHIRRVSGVQGYQLQSVQVVSGSGDNFNPLAVSVAHRVLLDIRLCLPVCCAGVVHSLRIPRDGDQRSELKPIGFTVVVRNGDRHRIGIAA